MFSLLVACYMFLGGAGAGASFVGCLLGFAVPSPWLLDSHGRVHPSLPHARLLGTVFLAGLIVVALGCFSLVVDLGQPARILNLFLHPTRSYISAGTFALSSLLSADLLLVAIWGRLIRGVPPWFLKLLQAFVLMDSLAVMLYTGLFLSGVKAVALWSATPLMPFVFVASSFTSGLALVVVAVYLSRTGRLFTRTLRLVATADIVCAALEISLLAALLVLAYMAGGPARESAESIISGNLGGIFWLGLVIVGFLTPLVLRAVSLHDDPEGMGFSIASMVLVGGLALRVCIIQAGTNPMVMLGAG